MPDRAAKKVVTAWTERLEPAATQANQLTPWTSGGRRYAIAFRPLLPDEATC